MGKKISKAFRDLQSLPPTKVKGKIKINRKKNNYDYLDNYAKELKETYPDRKIIRKKTDNLKFQQYFGIF
ncbi:hypothetical protein A5482_009745 [Cyanobacterium sp. IPPAS B-1200]|uniref:hypothetical protein n=1 Tax=Cyanobacterium sp. IPPAS B-1200 TaxID=1562720 RepID=UPI00085268EF|nr:hypothetical protein [Cyanobacterium sp. IPPAS B-1200]OEJ80160.1 hypothetical protein A5482_06760 [Cyanobacterium sp. IPPAS B-1200]